ncbi:hypothetical protein D1007_43101 [Hordeum vulgare]|nr:hypothetical protein D1007_43101 [Hordeum vulgare]
MSILGNWLSILIDLGPLLVVLFSYDWKEVSKFFSLKSFILGAVMNFLLVSHVLFVIDEKEKHRDVLFVSVVGFCTATVYAFFLLVHRVVMKNSRPARYLMVLVLLCFVFGCLGLLSGIFAEYQSDGEFINTLGVLVVFLLNVAILLPAVTCKPIPDDEATIYTVFMSVMNAIDASFFVFYAVCLGKFGRFLAVISSVNAVGALLQLLALSVIAILKGLRKGLRKLWPVTLVSELALQTLPCLPNLSLSIFEIE